tara:strand:- start:1517 stop:1828 length:312 start_codon:yes stop_codon:yes gene_type:complete
MICEVASLMGIRKSTYCGNVQTNIKGKTMKADILPKSMQAMLERHIAGKDFILVKQVDNRQFVVSYEVQGNRFYRAMLGLRENGAEYCYVQEIDSSTVRIGVH